MARKRSKRRRRRGVGSVIQVKPALGRSRRRRRRGMRGLGRKVGGMLMYLVAPLIGIGVPAATILALRAMVDPMRGQTQAGIVRYAPAIGLGVGTVTSLVIGMLGGWGPALSNFAVSGITAGAFSAYDMVRRRQGARIDMAFAAGGGMAPQVPADAAQAGLGVIVPEFRKVAGLGRLGAGAGTGAIVMQRTQGLGSRGEVISLGSVDPSVFGTPGF